MAGKKKGRSRSKSPAPRKRKSKKATDELREIFDALDTDGSGSIDFEELRDGVEKIGLNMPDSKLERLIEEADVDNDDEVDFEEFKKVVEQSKKWKQLSRTFGAQLEDLLDIGQEILRPGQEAVHRNITFQTARVAGGVVQKPSGCARIGSSIAGFGVTAVVVGSIGAALGGIVGVGCGNNQDCAGAGLLAIQALVQTISLVVNLMLFANGYGHLGHYLFGFKVVKKDTGKTANFFTLWLGRAVLRAVIFCTGIGALVEFFQIMADSDGLTDSILGTQVVLWDKSADMAKRKRQ